MVIRWVTLVVCGLSSIAVGQQLHRPPADMIIVGGRVVTVDTARPTAEGIAIRGSRILAIGSAREVLAWAGPETQQIQLEPGQTVIPGFIEGHGHFLGLGESLMMLDLANVDSFDEIVEEVAAAAAVTPPGEWIVGRGWHQSKWSRAPEPNVEGYPSHESLSAVSPNHPVLLTHASGHMNMANAYAMRLGNIDAASEAPSGGEILKNAAGDPIGVFRETAQQLVSRAMARDMARMSARQRQARFQAAVELAGQLCWRHGVTSFQDAGTSLEGIRGLKSLASRGELPVRLWVMARDQIDALEEQLPQEKSIGWGEGFLTVRAIKLSLDGALGPHGAWLLAPYDDLPTSTGLNTVDVAVMRRAAELADRIDFQLCVHAIGDRANRETLDVFEQVFAQRPTAASRRWRIEHAQHLHPDDIPRFGQLGVIASMQGIHCTSDAVFVLQRLGRHRAQTGAYMWRDLIDSGAVVSNGTDAPVEPIDPIASFYASVTRRLKSGAAFFPEQRMTRMEALRSYTLDAAYAAFEEGEKGSLVPGKLADLVVLSRDLLECADEDILDTRVVMTVLNGRIVYQAESSD
ncbi:MAG TPA: amidohydrolase [Pirellulaceae bacterium]|nr:amidohydrolase [Pirellulaceae bacterium]